MENCNLTDNNYITKGSTCPKHRIFISQPFSDINPTRVEYTRELCIRYLKNLYTRIGLINSLDNGNDMVNIEIIDNYHKPKYDKSNKLWCLGDSIQQLGTANLIVFSGDYASARGCRIEMEIAKEYSIPYIILPDIMIVQRILGDDCDSLKYQPFIITEAVTFHRDENNHRICSCPTVLGFSRDDAYNGYIIYKTFVDRSSPNHYSTYKDLPYGIMNVDIDISKISK